MKNNWKNNWKNSSAFELLSTVVLAALLVVIWNPLNLWMPDMMHMFMLAGVFVAFGVYATFIIREKAKDEREGVHRMFAGRVAYLAGSAVLIAAILYQSLFETLDTWLVFALFMMVISKIAAHWYSDRCN